ncbi:MAG: hypothetical protein K0S24_1323 [Sphingobacterium sp.]|jgi:hypothetical protein|nr:hypothetical protein [Sphingobacterium sp.]
MKINIDTREKGLKVLVILDVLLLVGDAFWGNTSPIVILLDALDNP